MYGSCWLAHQFGISRDKARRLMQALHLVAAYPKRRTSLASHNHKKYPYLLRRVVASRPNQVRSADITYLGLTQRFAYLTAIRDWYSRMILARRLSNTLDVGFCIDCPDAALEIDGEPEIFNSDQGSQ
jgi:putative transposase